MKTVELKKVNKQKTGRIITGGAKLEAHEYATLYFLAELGLNIEVIRPTNTPYSKSPDFMINGAAWEAKSPDGKGKYTLQRNVHNAGRQSDRLVLDLRRIKMPAKEAEKEALKRFEFSQRMRRMILITKDGRALDIRK